MEKQLELQSFLNDLKFLITSYEKGQPELPKPVDVEEIKKAIKEEVTKQVKEIKKEIMESFESEVKDLLNEVIKESFKNGDHNYEIKEAVENWIDGSYELEGIIKDKMKETYLESIIDVEYFTDEFLKYLRKKILA